MRQILEDGLLKAGITPVPEMLDRFLTYRDLLLEWNEKFNLTAITEEKDIAAKHFIDSLSIWSAVKDGLSLVDVGSGAGFPAIPLKIAGYEGETVLMDSLKKRVGFLETAIKELGLENCRAVHIRAEDAGRGEFRESFDIAVARAVAGLPVLCEYCIPLIKKGGLFIAMKGPEGSHEAQNSVNAIKKLGGRLDRIESFDLQFTGDKRTLIYIKKKESTPAIYPRKAGTPAKRPL
ncbi:MAG: 16S rRNA (guanine(527)-N(7))-methyltransferase RsmG [Clostridia bacterium]